MGERTQQRKNMFGKSATPKHPNPKTVKKPRMTGTKKRAHEGIQLKGNHPRISNKKQTRVTSATNTQIPTQAQT